MVRRFDFISWRGLLDVLEHLRWTAATKLCLLHLSWSQSCFVTLSSEMNDPRARLATWSSGWSWIPPCPRLVPLLRVAENASSLKSLPRRSVPQTAFCTSRQALLCSASRDRATRLLRIVVFSASASGLQSRRSSVRECVRHSCPQLSPLRMAVCLVVSGHLSTQTCFELIDRSSCLVEPVVVVGRTTLLLPVLAQTCTQHVQRCVRSLLANIPIAMP